MSDQTSHPTLKCHWQAEVWRIERTEIGFCSGWNHNIDNMHTEGPCSINILKVRSLNFDYHIDNEVNCNFSQDYVKNWMKYWKFSINSKNLLIFSHICKTSILPKYSLLIHLPFYVVLCSFSTKWRVHSLASKVWSHHKAYFGQ